MRTSETSRPLSIAESFQAYLSLWLDGATRVAVDGSQHERIAALRSAELNAAPLSVDNVEGAIELAFTQFRSEPLTVVAGFEDDVLRATLADIFMGCARAPSTPSLVVHSRGRLVALGVTTPFEEHVTITNDMPPAVQRLFGAINESTASVQRVRRRLRDPLMRPFEWLIAATVPELRRRVPTGDVHAPSTLFHLIGFVLLEVARSQGFATVVAHANETTARSIMEMGTVVESTIPYRELKARARDDVPGSVDFVTGDIARILGAVEWPR